MTQDIRDIPIFPLHTVFYPGGALPLRIFEPRYLDMIGQCLRDESGLGICLISEGTETGEAAESFEYGTFATISYWQQLPEGILGITVRGQQRFRIISKEITSNQLCIAQVEMLPNEKSVALPKRFQHFAEMVEEMFIQIGHPYTTLPKHYDDASWIGYRLAELLPMALVQKQHFLQMTDPIDRLERISIVMAEMDGS
ncbi:MAG: LON peptidase substrate-binding domain-containing protein [Sulfuriflexus sp.]|nr:LON peptidase substrate-binding domain-containing protein [Sulfuriflexus sp.]